jgi:hypothetical protein
MSSIPDSELINLKNEINNDPTGKGYKNPDSTWKGASVIAGLLNERNTGTNVRRKKIKPNEIFDSIPYAEYELYDQAKRDYIDTMLELAGGDEDSVIDATDTVVFGNIAAIFPANSDARTNILAKIDREGSRAEVLWGEGTIITGSDVGKAEDAT